MFRRNAASLCEACTFCWLVRAASIFWPDTITGEAPQPDLRMKPPSPNHSSAREFQYQAGRRRSDRDQCVRSA